MQKRSIFKIIGAIAFFELFAICATFSQQNINVIKDLQLIQSNEVSSLTTIEFQQRRKPQFLIKKDSRLIDKINPVKLTFGGLLYFYQSLLSQQFSADCLYEPSCSHFSQDVIAHYGIFKGIFLTADRLSRCNRIAQTSLHPLSINSETGHSRDSYTRYKFRNK
jgi:putative component of membrane protein insertase Oxa1/YidC/SpoIIIJ protein YidD